MVITYIVIYPSRSLLCLQYVTEDTVSQRQLNTHPIVNGCVMGTEQTLSRSNMWKNASRSDARSPEDL